MRKVFFLLNLIIISSFISPLREVKAQDEFVVNTYSDSTQRDPQIATTPSGEYMVVWTSINQASGNSKGDIYFQLFDHNNNKVFPEEKFNTDSRGNQEKPALAVNKTGIYVAAWQSFSNLDSAYDIKARVYSPILSSITTEFVVNTTIANSQADPDVDIFDDGSFVVVWDSWDQDGSDRGIYAQIYKNRFEKNGNEFLVNTTTAYSQAKPAVKYFSNGNFIVVWESWKQDKPAESGYGVFAQIFDKDGNKIGNEFQVNTYVNDYQWFADITTFDDDSFSIAWCSWEQDGSDGGIYVQRFNSNAEKVGEEILINKSTPQYQWLPRIVKTSGKEFAVVWSSWKQDGNREGVYASLFDENGLRKTFETQVNDYSESYQWEPDVIVKSENELLVVWASWNQFGKDYDIIGKQINLYEPQGYVEPDSYKHPSGRTTTEFVVHIVDSTRITGNTYEMGFSYVSDDSIITTIKNLSTGAAPVENFFLLNAEKVFLSTPIFDGIQVELIPELDLALDETNSYFKNHSGTNISCTVGQPAFGTKKLPPIDAILVWGKTDTLANGDYAFPLDTALNRSNGLREIIVPFFAWDITENKKITTLVSEATATKNKRWSPKEPVVFITPPPYQQAANNTYAQISTMYSGETVIMPTEGDTVYVLTTRPLSTDDKFTFQTSRSNIILSNDERIDSPNRFRLEQNYPNPFNPVTTIKFTIPNVETGHSAAGGSSLLVTMKIFDILGREVTTLVNENKKPGIYEVKFDGSKFSSGVYFYTIEFADKIISRKMILLK